MIYSTMIYRWVNSGQRTFLHFLTIVSLGQFFGLHEVTHDGNEPTVPANEDLVGTNSFQDMWGGRASAYVGKRKKHRSNCCAQKTCTTPTRLNKM